LKLKPKIHSELTYYEKSSKERDKFENTLKSLCNTIKKRQLDKKLNVELKDPKDYQLDDVFSMAQKILDQKEVSENSIACMRIIKTCFRSVAKHKSSIANVLECAPSDIYGSVIAGGFTLILIVRY
jgi:hypothetical protein